MTREHPYLRPVHRAAPPFPRRPPDGVRTSEAHEAVAARLGLGDDDRAERVPSGIQPLYKNRNGWAHDRLKRAGLSSSPKMGFWRLTPQGLAYAAKNKQLSPEMIEAIAAVDRGSRVQSKGDDAPALSTPPLPVTGADKASPEERIEEALEELRDSVSRDLLEFIGRSPPEFFEKLVLELLHKMGYGTSRADLQRTGGSGDGGIDGTISLDRLGLEKVYIQAKRWKNTVGSPEIQGFMGALQLHGASKGVFVTTSSYTKDAKQAAGRARGTIVLVDGERLATLMIDNGVGVSHKALIAPKVDNDYFEEG